MEKLIFTTVACVFLTSTVFANDFNIAQTKVLDKIVSNMEIFKNNPAKMDMLSQKKICVEKATDINTLATCLSQFPPEHLKATTK